MSYVKYKFHDFEEDAIEKYFPEMQWSEDFCHQWYRGINIENFDFKFCNMMQELIVTGGVLSAEFWVDPVEFIFVSKSTEKTRNIWEYYRHVCKELSR